MSLYLYLYPRIHLYLFKTLPAVLSLIGARGTPGDQFGARGTLGDQFGAMAPLGAQLDLGGGCLGLAPG